MSRRILFSVSISLFALAVMMPAAHAETTAPVMKPGKWETTMTLDIPGLPVAMKPITTSVCLSEEDAADPDKSFPSATKDPKCKIVNMKVDGNKVTWNVKCSAETDVSARGEMTVGDDRYEGVVTAVTGGQEISTKIKGKRLGDCTKKK